MKSTNPLSYLTLGFVLQEGTALTRTMHPANQQQIKRLQLSRKHPPCRQLPSSTLNHSQRQRQDRSNTICCATSNNSASSSSSSASSSSRIPSSIAEMTKKVLGFLKSPSRKKDKHSSSEIKKKNATEERITTTTTTATTVIPSYRQLWIFILTTVIIWLSEPLLSLIDTTIVGRASAGGHMAVLQVAAMGPATLLIDSCIYLTYFLAIATTNLLAKALAERSPTQLRKHSSHVLGVAACLGTMITVVSFAFGKPLLRRITSSNEELIAMALSYARIRSLVAPLTIMGIVAQAICLSCLDTRTPALAVAAASLVNIVGDLSLVGKFRMGIQGAAIATAVASATSSLILLGQVNKKMQKWSEKEQRKDADADEENNDDNEDEKDAKSSSIVATTPIDKLEESSITTKTTTTSTRSVTQQRMTNATVDAKMTQNIDLLVPKTTPCSSRISDLPTQEDRNLQTTKNDSETVSMELRTKTPTLVSSISKSKRTLKTEESESHIPFISFPDATSFLQLVKLSGPLFFVMLGQVVCYSALTLRMTTFGVVALASHNVMMRIFFFFTPFGDSISQAAEIHVPQVLYYEQSVDKKKSIGQLLAKLGSLAAMIGVINSRFAVWILQNCGSYFTKDTSMMSIMATNTRYIGLALLLHPFIMIFEGTIVATRDLAFLVSIYALTIVLLMTQLRYVVTDFEGVWRAMFLFQALRLSLFSSRCIGKTLRGSKK